MVLGRGVTWMGATVGGMAAVVSRAAVGGRPVGWRHAVGGLLVGWSR